MQGKDAEQQMPPLGFEAYGVLLPSVLGLAFASSVVNLCVQAAHATTGTSLLSRWILFASAFVMGLLFLSTLVIKRFTKRSVSLGVFLAIHLAGLCSLVLALASWGPLSLIHI